MRVRAKGVGTGEGGLQVFDTAIGPIGIAWTARGIDRLQLPEVDRDATLARLMERAPGRALARRLPPALGAIARRLRAHLAGRSDALLDVALDLEGSSPFTRRVYGMLRRVPPGQTVTYADLARRAGRPGAARAVGRAMATNPVPLLVPCHRVLTSSRGLGGFTGHGGVRLKARILFAEGVVPDERLAAALERLGRRDPVLRRLIRLIGPLDLRDFPPGDPYEALVESIVYQQLAGKAAAAIAARLQALTPGPGYPNAEALLRLPARRLRAAGLSRQKLSYLRDLAARVQDGRLELRGLRRLSDDALVSQLTQIRGIGRWSAEMFLLFHLHRPDILPVGDFGFRSGVKQAYGLAALPGPKELEAMGERWRPHRSLATLYFWRVRDVKA